MSASACCGVGSMNDAQRKLIAAWGVVPTPKDRDVIWPEIRQATAPSAEEHFHDNLQKREVQEVAQSGQSPKDPTEKAKEPGGDQFSTLNKFVIETAQPVPPSVPANRDELPKAEAP